MSTATLHGRKEKGSVAQGPTCGDMTAGAEEHVENDGEEGGVQAIDGSHRCQQSKRHPWVRERGGEREREREKLAL